MLHSGVRRIRLADRMRRTLGLLMGALWLWILASAALNNLGDHHHGTASGSAATCGSCTITLGLIESPAPAATGPTPQSFTPAPPPPPPTAPVVDPVHLPHSRGPPPSVSAY